MSPLILFVPLIGCSIAASQDEQPWQLYSDIDGLVVVSASPETIKLAPTMVQAVDKNGKSTKRLYFQTFGDTSLVKGDVRLSIPETARKTLDKLLSENFDKPPKIESVSRIRWGVSLYVGEELAWSSVATEREVSEKLRVQAFFPKDADKKKGLLVFDIEVTRQLPPTTAVFTIDWESLQDNCVKAYSAKGYLDENLLEKTVDDHIATNRIRVIADGDSKAIIEAFKPLILARIADTILTTTPATNRRKDSGDDKQSESSGSGFGLRYSVKSNLDTSQLNQSIKFDQATTLDFKIRKKVEIDLIPSK